MNYMVAGSLMLLQTFVIGGLSGCGGSDELEVTPEDIDAASDGPGDTSPEDAVSEVWPDDAQPDAGLDTGETMVDTSDADTTVDPEPADVSPDTIPDTIDDIEVVDAVDDATTDIEAPDVPEDIDASTETTDAGPPLGLGENQSSTGMHQLAYLATVGWIHAYEDGTSGTWRAVTSVSEDGVTWTEAQRITVDDGAVAQRQVSLSTCERLLGGETEEPWMVVSWTELRDGYAQLFAVEGPSPSALSAPVMISSHTDSTNLLGRVVCNEDGSLHAAWTRQHSGDRWDQTWYASKPYGGEWETQRAIFSGAHYSLDTDIVARGARIWVVTSHDTFFSTTLVLHRSIDGGVSWTTSDLLGYDAQDAVAWLPSMSWAEPGRFGGSEYLYLVYMDRPGTGVPVSPAVMRSSDDGETWSTPIRLSELELPDDNPGDRRRAPSLQPTSWNRPYVMWADSAWTTVDGDVNDDVFLVGSSDDGASWPTRSSFTSPHNDRPEEFVQNRAAFGTRTINSFDLQIVTTWISVQDGVPTMQRRAETLLD